jgi:hypothetical protein
MTPQAQKLATKKSIFFAVLKQDSKMLKPMNHGNKGVVK